MDVTLKRFGNVSVSGKKVFQQCHVEFDDLGIREISVPIDAVDEVILDTDTRIKPAIQKYWDHHKTKVEKIKPAIDKVVSIDA